MYLNYIAFMTDECVFVQNIGGIRQDKTQVL